MTSSRASPAPLLATGLPAVEAGAVAAHLHGRTGQLAAQRGPLVAGDLVRRLPEAIGRVRGLPAGRPGRLGGVTNRAARAEVVVDLDAIAANTAVLRDRVARPLMAVVKADGYGHGLVPAARAVLAGGADALGVTVLDEALALRAAGVTAPVLSWLHNPGTDFAPALEQDVQVSANAVWGLDEVVAAAQATGRTAQLHLFVDTGLSREGATMADWPALVAAAARAQADGHVDVVGLWSHMAYADAPTHPTIGAQVRVFEEAVAHRAGRRAHRRPAAPGQLGGHGRAAGDLVRHGPARASPCTGSTRSADPTRARTACGRR